MIKHYKFLQNFLLILFTVAVTAAFGQSGNLHFTTVSTDDGRTIMNQQQITVDEVTAIVDQHFKSMGALEAGKMNVTRKYLKEVQMDEPMYLRRSKAVTGILLHFKSSEGVAAVRSIVVGSPADKAGLQKGDILKAVNNQPVNDLMDFIGVLCPLEGGNAVEIEYEREGVTMKKTINLDEKIIDYINPEYIDHQYASIESAAVKDLILEELMNSSNIHQISLSWGNDSEEDRMILFQVNMQGANKKKNILSIADVTVAPNPTNGRLYIHFSMDETAGTEVVVLNALGKKVFYEKLNEGDSYNKVVDLSGYAKGIYFVQMVKDQNRINKKVILQ